MLVMVIMVTTWTVRRDEAVLVTVKQLMIMMRMNGKES